MKTGKQIASGVLPICKKTGRILVIRRGLNQSNPGMWACFGGKFEDGVDTCPKDNAKREFTEESGYTGKYKISRFPLYVNSDTHSVFYTYVGLFEEEFTPDLENGNEAIDLCRNNRSIDLVLMESFMKNNLDKIMENVYKRLAPRLNS